MFKSLGFGKKKPATDAQIRKHRDQARIHRQWSNDVSRIQAITATLSDKYKNHKGDFALGRYEELKQMIKTAIQEYRQITDKSAQKPSRAGATSALANKYGGGGKTAGAKSGQDNGGGGGGGFFARLKETAAGFASTSLSPTPAPAPSSQQTRAAKEQQKEKEMETWGYEGRSGKEIEEETECMRKEVLQFKSAFRTERDKFERLAKEYEDSKEHAPPQRYTVLKYMIKDHVEK